MKTIRTLLLGTLCLMAVLAFVSESVMAQGMKIGFVRDDRIKEEYKAWNRAQEQWDTDSKAWEDEATAMQTELQELLTEYEKQKLILSEEKRNEKEAVLRTKQEALDAFTRTVFGPGGKAERRQAELIEPLLEKASAAIEAVAIEGNYDVIFTLQSGLGYIKESYDVTDKVLEYLAKEEN